VSAQVTWRTHRAKIANTLRRDPAADVTELRREMRAEQLADHIKAAVDASPPLTDGQRARLAALLSGGPDAAA
jgi:hypothetical protein